MTVHCDTGFVSRGKVRCLYGVIVGLAQDVPLCDIISMFKPAYKLIKLRIKLIKEIKMPRATRYWILARVTLVTKPQSKIQISMLRSIDAKSRCRYLH